MRGGTRTDAASKSLEVSLFRAAGQSNIVDLTHDACIGTRPAGRSLSVTLILEMSELNSERLSLCRWILGGEDPTYIVACACDIPRKLTPVAVSAGSESRRPCQCCRCAAPLALGRVEGVVGEKAEGRRGGRKGGIAHQLDRVMACGRRPRLCSSR